MRKKLTVAREQMRRHTRIRFVDLMGLLSKSDKKCNVMASARRLKDKGASTIRIAGASLIEGIVGLTYPPRCLGCSERLFDARAILCFPCFHGIDRASAADIEARLARLPEADSVLDNVVCLWIFDKGGAIQVVHQALKYGNRPSYGVTLGEPIGAIYMSECQAAEEVEMIIPIPLHRSRLHERGYNQAEMLALGVSGVLDADVYSEVLIRPRPTKTQTALKRSSRWKNLEGAFCVADPESVVGRHVLLVDDVLTTGSTAGAAAKVLLEAGARRVDLATLAMART